MLKIWLQAQKRVVLKGNMYSRNPVIMDSSSDDDFLSSRQSKRDRERRKERVGRNNEPGSSKSRLDKHRDSRSKEKIKEDREKDRLRKAEKRKQRSVEQHAADNVKAKDGMATHRSRRKAEKVADDNIKAKEGMATRRARRSTEEVADDNATARDGMATYRARRSAEEVAHDNATARDGMATRRARRSVEEVAADNATSRHGMATCRARRSAEEVADDNATARDGMANYRANMSQDQADALRRSERLRKAIQRENWDTDELEAVQERDRVRKAVAKPRKHTAVTIKDGLRSQEVLQGTFQVEPLDISLDALGKMDIECEYCGALTFKKERPGICCSSGKVPLTPFPRPPDLLHKLWTENDSQGMLFRKNSREINNAVCLSSIQVKEKRFPGYNPSVIFQGKVNHRTGPLLPADGEHPVFAQLYVYDAALENTQRFQNMILPENLTKPQKIKLKQILDAIQSEIHRVNPFVADFKQILEIDDEELAGGKIVICAKAPNNEHARRYNLQTNLKEVSVLTTEGRHDLVIMKRGGGLQFVSDLNPKGMALHFTLLFPYGTYGWDSEAKHTDGKRRITPREFFAYHLQLRTNDNENFLHRACRLFQEWIVMGWITVQNQRLNYQSQNQKALRADTYKNIREATEERIREAGPRADSLYPDDHQTPRVGRKILASSFPGGPRWYNAKFQDGMAIVREYNKPDFFITMTTNPKWPEIERELLPGQTAEDRPDLVARVFKLKSDQFLKDLTVGELLGKVVAHMDVIEFQKRGLPHRHILLILADHDRLITKDFVDNAIVAELPPSPLDTSDINERQARQKLQDIVLSSMIHGPCGPQNPRSPCMENGKCTKNFPKPFVKETIVSSEHSYATYRRRSPTDGGRSLRHPSSGILIDNSWVVPYNPYLSARYECHINVECCSSPKATKYLFKYVTKGNDRCLVITTVDGEIIDEIQDFIDMRSVGSSEAVWHLLGFPITDRYPSVLALRVHLEEQQQIIFDENTEVEALENQRDTELTAFFKFNEENAQDLQSLPKYVDMPKKHWYDKKRKEWKIRKKEKESQIGRVHSVNPVAGDIYYLRILLHDNHCRGKKSFLDMLTLQSGRVCETYKEVCFEVGLLSDDKEWHKLLEVAAFTNMCPQIRELYVIILIFCLPSDPFSLLEEFWDTWTDDFQRKAERRGYHLSEGQLKTMVLLDIEARLDSFGKTLCDFRLPIPTADEMAQVEHVNDTRPAVIREELDFDLDDMKRIVQERVPTFTDEQNEVFNVIIHAVENEMPLSCFIDARGGCGKTYLLNTILAAVRSLQPGGCVALALATTGIAANLLALGRTFHSRMKAPLDPEEDSTLAISSQSNLAKLIRMSKLILIDEATMLDAFMLGALDRSLRDIMGKAEQPFGGKIIVLAGDFRQCLPVVPGANRAGIVKHCINHSNLWGNLTLLKLTKNMRVQASGDPILEDFDQWTLKIGNGEISDLSVPQNFIATKIIPNSKNDSSSEGKAMQEFCEIMFPDLEQNITDRNWVDGRAILATTNKEVMMLNNIISGLLPGDNQAFRSSDELESSEDLLRFNSEYLNSLNPNGFPPHLLNLKPGMPLMLLRNINPRDELCNGTKLLFEKSLDNKVNMSTLLAFASDVGQLSPILQYSQLLIYLKGPAMSSSRHFKSCFHSQNCFLP